jgi:catechol 2,3-dioxygenase-like lactoylglutathione lyase family enzyme
MGNKAKFGFVLEYVTDIVATKRFYVEVLGLEVERSSPAFIQFNNFAIASDESMGSTRDPEVYWVVEDAEVAFKDFSQKGEISLPLKQMPFGKVFGIKDPSGQPQYLVEFAKNRPSQPVK